MKKSATRYAKSSFDKLPYNVRDVFNRIPKKVRDPLLSLCEVNPGD